MDVNSSQTLSKKRSRSDGEHDNHPGPVATKRRATGTPPSSSDIVSSLEWSSPFGPTCLFGEANNATTPKRERVALFDLDGTLITSKSGARVPVESDDWRWLYQEVPLKLRQLHADGYEIFIVSNQMCRKKHIGRDEYYAQWKKKLDLVAQEISGVPFRVLASTAEDLYRKPLPGMWYAIMDLYRRGTTVLDPSQVVFVGDAAGRKKDHSASDRLFAMNIGISFHIPEEFFLGAPPMQFTITEFHPCNLPTSPCVFQPSNRPLALTNKLNIVVFVGFPAIGKTTVYKKYFEPKGYVRVDPTSFNRLSDRVEAIEKAIKAKKSVVIDDTNADRYTRRDYVDLAKKLRVQVRCVYFQGNIEHAWHNNVYRVHCMSDTAQLGPGTTQMIHPSVFKKFKAAFESPAEKVTADGSRIEDVSWKLEGFNALTTIYWKFDGTDEEFRCYMMWLFKLPV